MEKGLPRVSVALRSLLGAMAAVIAACTGGASPSPTAPNPPPPPPSAPVASAPASASAPAPEPSAVEAALARIDPDALSPREALDALYRLRALLQR